MFIKKEKYEELCDKCEANEKNCRALLTHAKRLEDENQKLRNENVDLLKRLGEINNVLNPESTVSADVGCNLKKYKVKLHLNKGSSFDSLLYFNVPARSQREAVSTAVVFASHDFEWFDSVNHFKSADVEEMKDGTIQG